MTNPSLWWLFVGLLFIGISIPLIREKVPPNRWYGFRVAKTFSSESIWYAANRVAGWDLLWAGVVTALAPAIVSLLIGLSGGQLAPAIANFIYLAIFISSISIAIVHSFITLNHLS